MSLKSESELETLIAELQENPDKIYNTDISEEDLLKIGKKLNPYSYIKPRDDSAGDDMSIAAISHTNLTEDYIRRFLMVSMVGFIHRMGDEYQIEPDSRVWKDPKVKINDKSIYEPLTIEKIKGNTRQINKYVAEYDIISERREKLKNLILTKELADEEVPKGLTDVMTSYDKSLMNLKFICTTHFTNMGEDATRRTEELVKEIKQYDDVYESIVELGYKPPPPPEDTVISEDFCKNQIKQFIKSYFEYNPDEHVRKPLEKSNLTPDQQKHYDSIDKYRPTMELLKAKVNIDDSTEKATLEEILNDRETYNACMYLLNKKPHLLQKLSQTPDTYKTALIPLTKERHLAHKLPPDDTFHRWDYYTEVNMEEIRNTVSVLYDEKPVFDLALQIYDTFKGTEEEVNEQKKKWISKYNEELSSEVSMVPMGNWVLLANYKKNREEIDFYNRQTEVLRRIMQRHEDDKKLGKDLMQKRVKKAKTRNIKEVGKDAEIMKKYNAEYANLTNLGAKRVLTYDEQKQIENIQKNIKELEEVADVPDDAIQVNVFTHDTEKDTFSKSAVYTESAAPLTHAELEEEIAKCRREGHQM